MLSNVLTILLLGIFVTVTTAQCTACFDGSAPSADRAGCQDIIDVVASLDASSSECQSKQLEAYQKVCCNSAPSICTVCPDGAAFNADTVVPNPRAGSADITCADLNGDLNFLDFISIPGICSDTLLQRSATWCGCPNTSRQCTLCSDGSTPANMNRIEKVMYKWDCRKSHLYSLFASCFHSKTTTPLQNSSILYLLFSHRRSVLS